MRSVLLTIVIILTITTFTEAAVLDINDLIPSTGVSSDGGMLTVHIDHITGTISILNTSGAEISFGAYSMFSATSGGGNLNPNTNIANANPQALFDGDGFNSIQQQAAADSASVVASLGVQALAFEVVSASAQEISEILGTAVLQPGASWSFGNALTPGTDNNANNFAFMYTWQNPSGSLDLLYSSEIVNSPEPTTMGLLFFGAISLLVRKRHCR